MNGSSSTGDNEELDDNNGFSVAADDIENYGLTFNESSQSEDD
jgi:hypothetical protein